MPLGFERLNERTQRPNTLINFIKPLEGADKALAQAFLSRIAAVVYPLMRRHHIAVMALEEHAPNREFLGRNFNAGEVIQLVLKAPGSSGGGGGGSGGGGGGGGGQWLPFRHVQMVMVHELAHCQQMNHSRAFWAVRDRYAEELRALWAQGYAGEGVWGRGRTLLGGRRETDGMPAAAVVEPRSLCGGTFRTSGGKRKRKREGGGREERTRVGYAERRQRRILKRFGTGGVALGDDDEVRVKLEDGRKAKGKPRVAGSKRGRELRAAAALARFEKVKEDVVKEEAIEEEPVVKEEEFSGSETESEYEEDGQGAAIDVDGSRMLDSRGRGMVKVCEEEDAHDENAQKEMEELRQIDVLDARKARQSHERAPVIKQEDDAPSGINEHMAKKPASGTSPLKDTSRASATKEPPSRTPPRSHSANVGIGAVTHLPPAQSLSELWELAVSTAGCSVCSLVNERGALTCVACANVLDPEKMPNHWRCHSSSCRGSSYVNAGDCGVCGVCGAAKSV